MNYLNNLNGLIGKMQANGQSDIAVTNFKYNFTRLVEGHQNFISEEDIRPVTSLQTEDSLDELHLSMGKEALEKTVLIKLNGGLGTSMGLNKAKSLIKIKGDETFLDVIAKQAIHANIPLVLMNSYATHADSMEYLKKYPELELNRNLFSFVQHQIPRITQENYDALVSPDKHSEWCPPGHGDLYPSLLSSGTLEALLDKGYEYAFISNSDNLGAVIDGKILGHFVMKNLPFLMEVSNRTQSDKKGGHLALSNSGKLLLRETAQCRDKDKAGFEDIKTYRYFNTNNIWINLRALKDKLEEYDNVLPLHLICNSKTVQNSNLENTPVFQLETAVGAAISIFDKAEAICVSRDRFIPVKSTADLLRARSNLFVLTGDYKLRINPRLKGNMPNITLDERFYKTLDDYEYRFGSGEPDLLDCKVLTIEGDFVFGEANRVRGITIMKNKNPAPLLLQDNVIFSGIRTWA
jgi:UDP-N-acetylglucosamine pyrophosphorylase